MELAQEKICEACQERMREDHGGGALIGMMIVGLFTFAVGIALGAVFF